MFTYQKKYALLTLLFFLVELYIGFCVQDRFIRPYGGDFLVVILIYFFLRTFLKGSTFIISMVVLIFAYSVEIAQHYKIVDRLGLTGNRPAEIIIGTGFCWWDILAYTLGVIFVYYWDKKFIINNG